MIKFTYQIKIQTQFNQVPEFKNHKQLQEVKYPKKDQGLEIHIYLHWKKNNFN